MSIIIKNISVAVLLTKFNHIKPIENLAMKREKIGDFSQLVICRFLGIAYNCDFKFSRIHHKAP